MNGNRNKQKKGNGSVTAEKTGAGSVLIFSAPRHPRKKCRTDPDAPPSLTGNKKKRHPTHRVALMITQAN